MIALEEWPVERRLPTRTVRPPPSTLARVTTPIDGWCAPGFAPVQEAFAANFAERGEVGAALSWRRERPLFTSPCRLTNMNIF